MQVQFVVKMVHLKKENIREIIAELSGRYFLRGYPSSLELLANLIEGYEVTPPEACFTASETLTYFQRDRIEDAFSCKVFDWYGTSEPAVLLFQDRKSYPSYRVPLFHCKLDLSGNVSGEARILGASMWDTLSNIGFYDTGDIAVLKDGDVVAIKGRSSDVVILNGLNVPVTNFLTVFYECPGVSRFQIINFKDVVLFIVRSKDDFDEQWLIGELNLRLGKNNYRVDHISNFLQSEFGKTPHFISQPLVSSNQFYNK